MILAIMGSEASLFEFDRLIDELDEIASTIDEEIIIQIGNGNKAPRNAKYFRFLQDQEFNDCCSSSRIIISHAGIGSIITALRFHKPLIIVPRMKKYGEHIDDHQLEIASEMGRMGHIKVIYDIKDLRYAISNACLPTQNFTNSNRAKLIMNMHSYLKEIELKLSER